MLPEFPEPTRSTEGTQGMSVDSCVEAFEAARAESGVAHLEAFVPHPRHPLYHEIVVELSRVDLEYAWESGDRASLDDYRRRFPDVFAVPHALGELAFEEYRLRLQAGDEVRPSQYARRYGVDISGWPQPEIPETPGCSNSTSLRMSESRRTSRPSADRIIEHAIPRNGRETEASLRADELAQMRDDTAIEFHTVSSPSELALLAPGASFLSFEIICELGSGAHGRVFLARQPALADRRVVLKITPRGTIEAERLASLQHGNVVPVYSVHSGNKLSAICMPYLGSVMLNRWIDLLRESDPFPDAGEAFLDRLAEADGAEHESCDSSKKPFQLLRRSGITYNQLVLTVVGQLAEGLAHAHRVGILHRDLKPANILLTDDGQPMLLDFHLSLKLEGDERKDESVGGTLPYMSPEQLASLVEGSSVRIDRRSDVYSLGVILFELLTGRLPFDTQRGSLSEIVDKAITSRRRVTSVRERNANVSPATDSIVRKCLDPDPNARYANAEQLSEDLQRQLENRPLLFAANPSIRERAAKWLRRHPRAASLSTLGILCAGLLLVIAVSWNLQQRRFARLQAYQQFTDLQQPLREAIASLSVPLHDPEERFDAITQAESILAGYHVHSAQPWTERVEYTALPSAQQEMLQRGMGELLYLIASAQSFPATIDAGGETDAEAIRLAIGASEKAVASFVSLTPPKALMEQRRDLLQQGGFEDPELASSINSSEGAGSDLGDDYQFEASRLLAQGNIRAALALLRKGCQKSPQDFIVWFRLGICYYALQRYAEAEGCFNTCLAISPTSRQARYRRGMARLKHAHYAEARDDFDHLLDEDQDDVLSLVCRGLAWRGEHQWQRAIDDFNAAVNLGFSQTRIYFLRSECYARIGDAERAEADRRQGMVLTPSDPLSWVARGVARLSDDPEGASEDFRKAIELNPFEGEAYRNLAHVLSERLDRQDDAIATLDEMLTRISEDPYGWAGRAVLHARKQHVKEAHDDALHAIALSEAPIILYQIGCVHALAPKDDQSTGEALRWIARAIEQDSALVRIAATDPDLRSLHSLDAFGRMVAAARILQLLSDKAPEQLPAKP
jgi:serine/threonine protein kinase/Flp pilus assembly protein TadD